MRAHPWQVVNWRRTAVSERRFRKMAFKMTNYGNHCTVDGTKEELRRGQCVWATEQDGVPVGIAWDWVELRPGVFALADPMTVISNVVLVTSNGSPLNNSAQLLRLNDAIHSLPWQRHLDS